MLTCITCAKQTDEKGEEGGRGRGTPRTKESVKSLTAQVLNLSLPLPCLFHLQNSLFPPFGFCIHLNMFLLLLLLVAFFALFSSNPFLPYKEGGLDWNSSLFIV